MENLSDAKVDSIKRQCQDYRNEFWGHTGRELLYGRLHPATGREMAILWDVLDAYNFCADTFNDSIDLFGKLSDGRRYQLHNAL